MSLVEIDYLGEGASDDAIARKLICAVPCVPGNSYRRPQAGTGKQSLDRRLRGLNAGVRYGRPILVIRDLDFDARCPADLVAHLLPSRHERLLIRICVREAEAWLMADSAAYARFCGLSAGQVPRAPETVEDPKQVIVGWAETGRASRLKRHLEDARRRAVPDWASLGQWHAEFVETAWNPKRAAATGRAPSLERALRALASLAAGRA